MMGGSQKGGQTVDYLIQDLEEGVITPEDREKLMNLMREHASVRELYLQHFEMASLLHQAAEDRVELGTMPVSSEMIKQEGRKKAVVSLTYGIAALLIIGIGFLFFQINQKPKEASPWIVMEGSQDAVFSISYADDDNRNAKNMRVGDKIVLDQGLVRFSFPSGVEAIVEGPSHLELTSDLSVKMDGGLAWFRVPKEGHGFTVNTESVRVIDLGTEFGVWFNNDDELQVHVAKGKVRVEPILKGMPQVELSGKKAMQFDVYGRGDLIDCRTSLFRRKFTYGMPYVHWSFDKLVDGGFEADGTMPGIDGFQAELRHLKYDKEQIDGKGCQIEGRFGRAFSMNGKGLFAESAFPGIGGNTPRTVAMWVRHRNIYPAGLATPYCAWGLRDGRTRGKAWKFFIRKSKAGHQLWTSFPSGVSIAEFNLDMTEWIHVVSIYTGRNDERGYPEVRYYINGVPQNVRRDEHPITVDTDIFSPKAKSVRFGASVRLDEGSRTVNGDLDELYIFRGVLNEEQIKQLMNNQRSGLFSK